MRIVSPLLLLSSGMTATDHLDEHVQLLQRELRLGSVSVDVGGEPSFEEEDEKEPLDSTTMKQLHANRTRFLFQKVVSRKGTRVKAKSVVKKEACNDEPCHLRENNLWQPEDIPPYISCLKSCCQDFDPNLIFDGLSCDDIIGMGFDCDWELEGLRHIPAGTLLSDMCSSTCKACEAPCPLSSASGWTSLADFSLEASSEWSAQYSVDNIKVANTNPWHDSRSGQGTDQWIELSSCEESLSLSGFRVKMHCGWDGSSFKNYKFQYSSDNSVWTDAKVGVGENQDCGGWQEITFPQQSAHYWRLFMENNHGYGYLSIEEMQVRVGPR